MSFAQNRLLQIAMVCYETMRAWHHSNSGEPGKPWAEANQEEIDEVLSNVRLHINNPLAGDAAFHKVWVSEKEAAGWVWGKEYDEKIKTHPDLRPFHLLAPERQAKDRLFVAVVRALSRV